MSAKHRTQIEMKPKLSGIAGTIDRFLQESLDPRGSIKPFILLTFEADTARVIHNFSQTGAVAEELRELANHIETLPDPTINNGETRAAGSGRKG